MDSNHLKAVEQGSPGLNDSQFSTPRSNDSTPSLDGEPIPLNDPEALDEDSVGAHQLARVMSHPEALERLESLSRVLSTRTRRDGKLEIDPEDFDLSVILRMVVNKMDDAGRKLNKVGVTFKNLTTKGVDAGASYNPSVGELLRGLINLPKAIMSMRNPPLRNIIEGFDGLIEAGDMVLVLGRPGSGCSTLLKTLAGEIDQFKGVEGELLYDGATQHEMLRHFKSEILYNPELDVHFPHLTVEQTLKFAIACRTPRSRLDNMSRSEYQQLMTDLLATVFGLRHTYKTKVGNDYVRGVSGGERKRVSIAEALAARGSVYCWDNATRGLDASTALEYNHAIRSATNFLENSAVVAIYQAGENIYKLYDKVTVVYSGKQIYFGPADEAKAFFEEMGYECPSRQTTAEFLTAVTDPNGRQAKPGYENRVPKTSDEFVAYWKKSPQYAKLLQDIDAYNAKVTPNDTLDRFRDVRKQSKMKRQSSNSKYLITYPAQVNLAIKRGFQRVRGDMAYTITNVTGNIIQALIMGSLFYNISASTSGAFSRGGVIFFALLFNSLSALAEITHAFEHRPILLKQKSYSFYHPSVEALQAVLSDLPVKIVTLVCFTLILYFLSNLRVTAGQFFLFLFVLIIASLSVGSLFQMIAALTKDASTANSVAGIGVLLLSVYTGYMIPTRDMHPWFRWINWLDPLAYGFESLMANEFHGREMPCDLLVPSGPGYQNVSLQNQVCAFSGAVAGQPDVSGDRYLYVSYDYSWSHFWRNVGIIFGFWAFFLGINTLATEYLRPVSGGGDVLLFKRGHMPDRDDLAEGRVADAEELHNVLSGSAEGREIFSWQHVDYTIPLDGGHRRLLDDVQGYVKPGTLTALMGESGAGKTTLLNVLSQRIHFGVITGDMLVNGRPIDESFQRRTGYVQQQDLHLAEASVRESLQFAARLRQPASVPDSEKMEYVEKIIKLLGMGSYAEAIVGSIGRGLNVEQRKKLSIGVELVAKPSLLLFLDEPTSGLDSQSAWAIVTFLRSLADAGQAILCTIHQPSATLFEVFDRLLLLKKGGQTVYFGDIGKNSETLISYFERQGARKCGPEENPAEYILECIGAGATAHVAEDWHQIWKKSPECHQLTDEIAKLHAELAAIPVANVDKSMKQRFASPYRTQFWEVYKRANTQFWRSPTYILAKFLLMIVGGLFIGFTFWDINFSLAGLQNAMFGIFLIQVLSAPLTNQIQAHAVDARELYEVREASSNTFHWSTLLLSQYLAELPYHLVFSTLLFCCFYFPVKYPTTARVAGYFYFNYCILFQLYYVSFALMVVYCSPNAPSAAIISSVLFSFMIAFCGVMQPVSQMPGFWTFMYKVSPYTYFIQNYMAIVMHDRPVNCAASEWNIFQPPQGMTCGDFAGAFTQTVGGFLQNPNDTSDCHFCKFKTGDDYLASVGASYSYRWRNIGFICVYIVFNIVAMLALYYLFRVKVWSAPKWLDRFKKKAPAKEEPKDIYAPQDGDEEMVFRHRTNTTTNNEGISEKTASTSAN
ncbi:protein Snq2p [Trichomonascus vanleenenianus]|uniref:protein Snq2p n=1 Tax=Trichomonascus vanleenenianus TaxID=2268995 RepID=UPI003ECACE98